ncbi:protease complex subunit PrcB family protein [Winogradskyella tangerina]|uniref:protease complex subunit PrcB family protein n=1 Tax=Winogradskyella tangerina TaxID=2023240 RepID=UPI000DBE8A96|nr:protease complex subunit PrcB family protein [Winogradskyella tangerina]
MSETVTIIASGELYGAGEEGIEQQNTIITNQKDWDSLVEKMSLVNPLPDDFSDAEIDFSKYQVIALFDDLKSTGGHSIAAKITEEPNRFVVKIERNSPSGMATTVVTQPYFIAKIKSKSPIVIQ